MKIAVLGTGMVGRALAGRLAGLGHDVVVGTRDVNRTLTRTEPGAMGAPPYAEWQCQYPDVRLVPFREAGIHAELVVNATAGAVALDALQAVGKENLAGKVLVDLAIPLDFSAGMPPRLIFANSEQYRDVHAALFLALARTRHVRFQHRRHAGVISDDGVDMRWDRYGQPTRPTGDGTPAATRVTNAMYLPFVAVRR